MAACTIARDIPKLPPLPVSDIRAGATHTLNDPQAIIDAVLVLCEIQEFQPRQLS